MDRGTRDYAAWRHMTKHESPRIQEQLYQEPMSKLSYQQSYNHPLRRWLSYR
jgi:hypothetical protein